MHPGNVKFQNHNRNSDRHLIACALRWRPFYTPEDFTVTGGEYKLVLATQYFFCQLHPDLMSFLWRHLPRLKGLDQVAAQVCALVDGMAACPFKFNVGGLGSAAKRGHQQLSVRLVGIANIVNGRFQR